MPTLIRTAFAILLLVLLAACTAAPQAPQSSQASQASTAVMQNISVQQLKADLDSGAPLLLLDVRTPEEFANDGQVAGALLIPVTELESRLAELPKDQPIACICRSGNRSNTACSMLARNGFADVRNVLGGMNAWKQAGFPTEWQ